MIKLYLHQEVSGIVVSQTMASRKAQSHSFRTKNVGILQQNKVKNTVVLSFYTEVKTEAVELVVRIASDVQPRMEKPQPEYVKVRNSSSVPSIRIPLNQRLQSRSFINVYFNR